MEFLTAPRLALKDVLSGADDDVLDYFESFLADGGISSETLMKETLAPFVER